MLLSGAKGLVTPSMSGYVLSDIKTCFCSMSWLVLGATRNKRVNQVPADGVPQVPASVTIDRLYM